MGHLDRRSEPARDRASTSSPRSPRMTALPASSESFTGLPGAPPGPIASRRGRAKSFGCVPTSGSRANLGSATQPENDRPEQNEHDRESGFRRLGFRHGTAGKRTLSLAPPSGLREAEMVPPCSTTIFFTIASPRPVPSVRVVTYGSNTASRRSSGIPGPLSSTSSTTTRRRCRDERRPRPSRPRARWPARRYERG